MSIIGLLDWDLTQWHQPTVFNLELMKLAAYHKIVLRDIVQMEKTYSSEMCSKVYVQKDYEDLMYPEEIVKDPKVVYGGLALSDGIYAPMPLIVERSIADTSIYKGFERYYQRTSEAKHIFKIMNRAAHIRLTLDGHTLFPGWKKQLSCEESGTRYIIIHDKDIQGIKDIHGVVSYLLNTYGFKCVRLGFKYPVIIHTPQQLIEWGVIPKISEISNMYLMDLMPNSAFEAVTLTKQRFTYLINNDKWTLQKLIDCLSKILLQGIFLSKYAITLSLKIDRDFMIPDELKGFIDMLNNYFQACVQYRNTLVFCGFSFCKYCYNKIPAEEKTRMFQYVQSVNKDCFDILYGAEYVTYDADTEMLIPHMYTKTEIEQGGGYGGYYYKQQLKSQPKIELVNYADLLIPENLYLEVNDDKRRNSGKNCSK